MPKRVRGLGKLGGNLISREFCEFAKNETTIYFTNSQNSLLWTTKQQNYLNASAHSRGVSDKMGTLNLPPLHF